MSDAPRRDDSFDRLLTDVVRRGAGGRAGGECPDAEALAAWTDGGLPPVAAATLELHLADCARCQATLAAMSEATIESNAAVAGAASTNVVPMRRRPAMRWLAPVAAGLAAASLLFFIVGGGDDSAVTTPEASLAQADVAVPREAAPVAAAPLVAPTPAAGPPPPPPAVIAAPPPAATQAAATAKPAAAPLPAGQRADQTLAAQTPTSSTTVNADFIQALPRSDRNALNFVVFLPGVTVLPGTTIEFGPGDVLYQPPPARSQLLSGGDGFAASSRTGAAGRGGGGGGGGGRTGAGGRSAGGVVGGVAPPPPPASVAAEAAQPARVRWRILPTGSVARSTDGGTSWTAVPLDAPVFITQGAAPSSNVCWLIGRGGVVLVATAGTNFVRVPFPVTSPEAVLITATDARNATVNLADGRALTTSDGGQTWVQR